MRLRSHLHRLDKKLFATVAEAHLPGLERVLPRVSRAADNALLWAGISGALALSGRRRLRRAATRGLLAVSLASPLVNLVGKQAFNRRRPASAGLPIGRALTMPRSASFPSGHSASAAAFATAVAMEAPARIAVPVGLLAATVAFSRVYTGVHYPGDVLAGVGVGMAAGLLTRRIWPEAGEAGRARAAATAPADTCSPDGEGLVVLAEAGAERQVDALLHDLPGARSAALDETGPVRQAAASTAAPATLPGEVRQAKVLGVAGGDRAMAAGTSLALEAGVPLLPIPAGAPGEFSQALGLEEGDDAVAAYRSGTVVAVDVGRASIGTTGEERVFLNHVGAGLHPELARRTQARRHAIGKWPAMVVSLAGLLSSGAEPADLVVDGVPYRTWMVFAGNCRHDGRGPVPVRRQRLEDGLLDIRLLTAAARLPRLRAITSLIGGRLGLSRHYRQWHADTLTIEGARSAAFDGHQVRTRGPLVLSKRPRALHVLR
ncbi:bifunctional phosphatase PAP2/diacylglycerol kinase family protein [Nonomuraea sp. NPDC050663]|uniref:bifunctional phosphatase PAP2/diacylglycerol kinase family protein n=1 Tax=Nonomuraea sp. NPDC050663 TaxID=3364370 RepID=UPI0037B69F6B